MNAFCSPLVVLLAGISVAAPAAAGDPQAPTGDAPPPAGAAPEWPASGFDPEIPLPPMAPPSAASRFATPWFGARAGVGGRVDNRTAIQRPLGEILRPGPSITVDAGLRLRGYWVPFLVFRHENPVAGPALVSGTSVSDDALGVGSRWYWSWSTRQRVQLFAELRALAGVLRFGGSAPSSGSYLELGSSGGIEVRLHRRWSAAIGLAYSMAHLGTSVTPPVKDPTPLRPAPFILNATTYSAVAEIHYEPR